MNLDNVLVAAIVTGGVLLAFVAVCLTVLAVHYLNLHPEIKRSERSDVLYNRQRKLSFARKERYDEAD